MANPNYVRVSDPFPIHHRGRQKEREAQLHRGLKGADHSGGAGNHDPHHHHAQDHRALEHCQVKRQASGRPRTRTIESARHEVQAKSVDRPVGSGKAEEPKHRPLPGQLAHRSDESVDDFRGLVGEVGSKAPQALSHQLNRSPLMPQREQQERQAAGEDCEHHVGAPARKANGVGLLGDEEQQNSQQDRNENAVHDPLQHHRGHCGAAPNRAALVDQKRACELSQAKRQDEQHHEADPRRLIEPAKAHFLHPG